MKKYKNFSLTCLLVSAFGLMLSCNKEQNVTASIEFSEPTLNDTIHFNEELHMEGTIQGTSELHGFQLTAINQQNGQTLISSENHEHLKSYVFHEHWLNTLTDTSKVTITVKAEIDHEGNHETKQVTVLCLPN